MANLRYAWNWHSDRWIGTDAYIEIADCAQVHVNVYLPERPHAPEGKTVSLFDGARTHHYSVGRGRVHTLGPFEAVNGVVRLQIYSGEPEPVGDSDGRSLGVLMVGLLDAGNEFRVDAKDDDYLAWHPLAPMVHPDVWAVEDQFDRDFYLERFAPGAEPRDALLHFMVAGWRQGRDPNRTFSLARYLQEHPDLANLDVNPLLHQATGGGIAAQPARGRSSLPRASAPTLAVRDPALAFVEAAAFFPDAQSIVVVGWALAGKADALWLATEEGDRCDLDGVMRFYRADVFEAHGRARVQNTPEPGFLAHIPVRGSPKAVGVCVRRGADGTPHTLAKAEVKIVSGGARMAFQWIQGVQMPAAKLLQRIETIDVPLVEQLQRVDRASWKFLPVETRQLGASPPTVRASVIVPLYGRADFVEHQLVEFVRDEWFARNCELIYVIDDPALVGGFPALAEQLFRLYRFPFRCVWGSANRGFSGANNLGADRARGEHLVFMNSDVFPIEPGWVAALLQVLDEHPNVAAVAPRLKFPDGSIQHASIEFQRREELGIWINHHANMGLACELDPAKSMTIVAAVTGACMALRRVDFEMAGRWDTGYLIGDFEDSDLCLNLRSKGRDIAYLPTVELTHLERQSFRLLGHADFRQKVVIHNAVRHQLRWGDLIAPSTAPAPVPAPAQTNRNRKRKAS